MLEVDGYNGVVKIVETTLDKMRLRITKFNLEVEDEIISR